MLLVITIIAILASLLLPALARVQKRSKQVQCVNQLRQVGIAFHSFAHDHGDKFPMAISTNAGGTLELVRAAGALGGDFYFAYRHFQALSNELDTPKVLACPADRRLPASNFLALANAHVSYFVGPLADMARPDSILAGDRNLTNAAPASGPVIRLGTNDPVAWTAELHEFSGNILFADGRVEQLTSGGLRAAVSQSPGPGPVWPPVPAPPPPPGPPPPTGPRPPTGPPPPPTTAPGGPTDGGGNNGGGINSGGGNRGNGTAAGNAGASAAANSGGPTEQGLFTRLDNLLQNPSTRDKPAPAIAPKKISAAISAESNPSVAGAETVEMAAPTNAPAATNQAPAPAAAGRPSGPGPDVTAGDPWPVGLAQFIIRASYKITYALLLVLLAILIAMALRRRRRKRQQEAVADPEPEG